MNRNSVLVAAMGCATALVISAMLARAGNLNPDPGPVSPTMKTLDDIEPRIPLGIGTSPSSPTASIFIDQPGSYYLTGDITGESGKVGIAVVADDVTIDLNSYALRGVPGSLAGVGTSPGLRLCVCNGAIVGWEGGGVATSSEQVTLRDLSVRDNGGSGISVGEHSLIERCHVSGNGSDGVFAEDYSRIHDTTSINNGLRGFNIQAVRMSRCHASGNDSHELECSNSDSVVEDSTFIQDTDSVGTAAVRVTSFNNTVRRCRVVVNEPGDTGVDLAAGTGHLVESCVISTGVGATGAVALRIDGGRGHDNFISLDAVDSIGVLLDPGMGLSDYCEEEEEEIQARAAGSIGIRVMSGTGGIRNSRIVVTGDGALGIDVVGSSHYLVENNRVSVDGVTSTGVSLAAPAFILGNIFSAIAPNNLMITETAGSNSLISRNSFAMRSTGGTAIGLATFGNSMATKNLSIGQANPYTLPEGVQFGALQVDPGSGYATDSAVNLEVGP